MTELLLYQLVCPWQLWQLKSAGHYGIGIFKSWHHVLSAYMLVIPFRISQELHKLCQLVTEGLIFLLQLVSGYSGSFEVLPGQLRCDIWWKLMRWWSQYKTFTGMSSTTDAIAPSFIRLQHVLLLAGWISSLSHDMKVIIYIKMSLEFTVSETSLVAPSMWPTMQEVSKLLARNTSWHWQSCMAITSSVDLMLDAYYCPWAVQHLQGMLHARNYWHISTGGFVVIPKACKD